MVYLSETMTAKGLGIAALLNWIVIIMISFATPFMFSDLPTEFVYGFLMSLCFIGLIFINKYIIETKGLTRNQILQKISGYQVMDEISMHKDFEIKTKSNFIQY